MGDVNWRDKDDLELTSEDITAMAAEGQQVEVRGPRLPGNAMVTGAIGSYGLGKRLHVTPGVAVRVSKTLVAP